jgi:chromosome segregation ATPase
LRDLEKEKERGEALSRKNSELKNYLSACRKRMSRLFSDLREAEDNLEDLGSRYSLIKAENIALRKDKTRLKLVSEENENLKIILTSVEELKKIIRELKRQKRQAAREGGALEGNLGYVIKGGKPSCPPKIIIEVIPAPSPKRDEGNIPANSSE